MKIETSIVELRNQLHLLHPHCTALVPTMGNLHAGHLALVDKANEVADRVVVSLFINPLQFGPNEDYRSYPRTFEDDCETLEQAGVDVLFAPTVEEMYGTDLASATRIAVPEELSAILCGAARPGHFSGMATVVNMLFNVAQPDIALFGEKDYQQLLVIRRMARDLHIPVEIIGVPTVREPDGLAMSSRNNYLTPDERKLAPSLYMILARAHDLIATGQRNYAALEQDALQALAENRLRPDYVAIRRAADLGPPGSKDRELRILGAAWLGRARLIDNLAVRLPG